MALTCPACHSHLPPSATSGETLLSCPGCGKRLRLKRSTAGAESPALPERARLSRKRTRPAARRSRGRPVLQALLVASLAIFLAIAGAVAWSFATGVLSLPGPAVEHPNIPIRPEDATGPRLLQPGAPQPAKSR
jgi:hypothetical protein